MIMLNEEGANKVALEHLATLEKEIGEPLGLANSETLEKAFGWVFFYNSKDYIETGNFRSMLAGNAPFIVDRNSGEVHVTGTAKSVEDYITDYEQQLASHK